MMKDEAVQSSLRRAEACIDLERFDAAEKHAREHLSKHPHDADGHAILSLSLRGLKRLEGALEAVDAAIGLNPENEWYFRVKSAICVAMGKGEDALSAADEAVRLFPENPWAHSLRAEALSRLKRREEAICAIEKAIELDPNEDSYFQLLGDLHLKKDPSLAEENYRKALALNPQNAPVFNNLGVSLMKQKKKLQAAVAYKSAVLLNPTLNVAKSNVHHVVGSHLKVKAVSGLFLLWVLLRVVRAVAGQDEVFLLAGIGVPLVAILLFFKLRRQETSLDRMQELMEIDPQLVDLYYQLEEDKKAGML